MITKITDVFFKVDRLETFIYTFEHNSFTVSEYIHGIITEFIETDHEGAPTIVKIKQVSNLEDYLNKKEVTFTERILRIIYLQPIISFK